MVETTNNDMNYKITITNQTTGEKALIFRDVCTIHPKWVHEQCGTASEAELQQYLDGLNVMDWYRGGRHLGPDTTGMEMSLEGGRIAISDYKTGEEIWRGEIDGQTWAKYLDQAERGTGAAPSSIFLDQGLLTTGQQVPATIYAEEV